MPSNLSQPCPVLVNRDDHPLLDVGQAGVDDTELTHEVLSEVFAGTF
jgi:hypothetical protein